MTFVLINYFSFLNQQNIQHLAMFDWMEFSPDTLRLAGVQSPFAVRLYSTTSSQGTVALSAQAVRTIIQSPALVVDLPSMNHAFSRLLFKLLSVEVPLGILATLYQYYSKVYSYYE